MADNGKMQITARLVKNPYGYGKYLDRRGSLEGGFEFTTKIVGVHSTPNECFQAVIDGNIQPRHKHYLEDRFIHNTENDTIELNVCERDGGTAVYTNLVVPRIALVPALMELYGLSPPPNPKTVKG